MLRAGWRLLLLLLARTCLDRDLNSIWSECWQHNYKKCTFALSANHSMFISSATFTFRLATELKTKLQLLSGSAFTCFVRILLI
jgi:hypothetical protein